MKCLFLPFTCLPLFIMAQAGYLDVQLETSYRSDEFCSLSIYNSALECISDSIEFDSDGYNYFSDTVPVGIYYLKVFCDETLSVYEDSLRVFENLRTVYVYQPTVVQFEEYSDYSSPLEFIARYEYGQFGSPVFPGTGSVQFTHGAFLSREKSVDVGIFYNYGISLSHLGNFFQERYFYMHIGPEVRTRFKLSWDQKILYKRVWLDLGANYKLPLMFRRTLHQGHDKLVTRRIHQFTDINAVGALGIGMGSITAEYRLTDFIMGDHPELPKWNVGFALHVDF